MSPGIPTAQIAFKSLSQSPAFIGRCHQCEKTVVVQNKLNLLMKIFLQTF
jgi:hypothetical protein